MRNLDRHELLNPMAYNPDEIVCVQPTHIVNGVRLEVYEDKPKATSNMKEPKQVLAFRPRRDTDPDPKTWGAPLPTEGESEVELD